MVVRGFGDEMEDGVRVKFILFVFVAKHEAIAVRARERDMSRNANIGGDT